MRLPWVSRRKYDELDLILSHECENRDEYLRQRDEAAIRASSRLNETAGWARATQQARDERDEALARVADLERALGQFSAGEATVVHDIGEGATVSHSGDVAHRAHCVFCGTGQTTDLCDCPVSVVNEHLTGACRQALIEANDAGEMTGQPQELLDAAKESATRGQGHATELCDCELATLDTHLEGSCRQALIEAEQQGRFIGEYGAELRQIKQRALGVSDCTCSPGWKHWAGDCPFNPNPEREHRQRYG